jgi:hypothetical protein
MAAQSVEWIARIAGRILPIRWERQGDEWLEHLLISLAAKVQLQGHRVSIAEPTDAFPWPHVSVEIESPDLLTVLRLIRVPGGIDPFVTGKGDFERDQVAPWMEAMQEAAKSVRRPR